ncbi:glycosyltransferase involved in cell wall biosynthesis [Paraperlucidibaca baekdonensis]|uniref:Glycosyltransferase involved in cell wall biosynthesis n=1 Tax=Paraperlucidibaca baekdonensis TaxID=748120 RepID=A0A3E0H7H6_9GAMM|nr:glycosyltransferase family 2 protein [Paraperlucidibaca baekdonensis]REH39024.1 glycosyltransferase involved in cell wall biosynthesis [Paraperlucidibaca baekdonensis]
MTELTILMPCLNEAETLEVCIAKAKDFLTRSGIIGEVLVADNGSTDGSQAIARNAGARVIDVAQRGYGAALISGIQSSISQFVIMGDADDSYDFSNLMPFVHMLRKGVDLVMGNRFQGGIAPGAMPFLHRYLGNPVLSFLGRLFFRVPIGDFHCGLRGFNRKKILELDLQSSGMEFASEMVVKAHLRKLIICEVPTTLVADGRTRSPHLNTWTDGWRHLKFLLLHSPRWLFLYPSLSCLFLGFILVLCLASGPLIISDSVHLDIHSLVMGCVLLMVGSMSAGFALIARRQGAYSGLLPTSERISRYLAWFSLERLLIFAFLMLLAGLLGLFMCVWQWASHSFGNLDYASLLRPMIISGTAVVIGVQLIFIGFLDEILSTYKSL